MKLSVHEQRLLDFAREQFGEHLGKFLLAGLGEEVLDQRWRFTIKYVTSGGPALKRQIQVITHESIDGSSLLPRRRDPLVFLALLHLLLYSDHSSQNSLEYKQQDVLSLLGWKETKKAQGEIDEAINRYSALMYKWKMNRSELAHRKLSFYISEEACISEYKNISEEVEESGQLLRIFNRVIFSEHFIEQLMRRSLFEIDWNRVRSISRISPLKLKR